MSRETSEAAPEHIQVPENLKWYKWKQSKYIVQQKKTDFLLVTQYKLINIPDMAKIFCLPVPQEVLAKCAAPV